MNWYYFLLNILLGNAVNRVPLVLLVFRIVERNFPIENLEATYSKKHGSKQCSSAELHENIHSGLSSESDSEISIEIETEPETESETDSSDSEASFMSR